MGNILIGTCSWLDIVDLYPPKLPKDRFLPYYAGRYPVVEVNSTRYGAPAGSIVAGWSQRTPSDFIFDVKPPANLTYTPESRGARPSEPNPEVARAFLDALRVLDDKGKLGALTFQFPPSFQNTPENRDYLRRLPETYRGFLVAVELRCRNWLDDDHAQATFGLLREAGLVYMMVDEPQAGIGSVPPVYAVTNDELAIVRFHGRNEKAWKGLAGPNTPHTDWIYTKDELAEWVLPIQRAAREAKVVHLFINTKSRGQGPETVRMLAELLGIDLPPDDRPATPRLLS